MADREWPVEQHWAGAGVEGGGRGEECERSTHRSTTGAHPHDRCSPQKFLRSRHRGTAGTQRARGLQGPPVSSLRSESSTSCTVCVPFLWYFANTQREGPKDLNSVAQGTEVRCSENTCLGCSVMKLGNEHGQLTGHQAILIVQFCSW